MIDIILQLVIMIISNHRFGGRIFGERMCKVQAEAVLPANNLFGFCKFQSEGGINAKVASCKSDAVAQTAALLYGIYTSIYNVYILEL